MAVKRLWVGWSGGFFGSFSVYGGSSWFQSALMVNSRVPLARPTLICLRRKL